MKIDLLRVSLFLIYISSVDCSSNVRAVAFVTRHGDRFPRGTYPNDPFKDRITPEDQGMLTPKGCVRMYNQGKLLGDKFDLKIRNKTELKSSIKPRCIRSLECLMAGIDGPQKHVISYQIESKKVEDDLLLNHADSTCPQRQHEIETYPRYNLLYNNFSTLFEKVSNVTGETYEPKDIYFFFDLRIGNIIAEKLMGWKMPEWADDEFFQLAEVALDTSFHEQALLPIQHALNGVFFREMIDKFKSSSKDEVSLFGYSTHDTTLGPLMAAVNAWTDKRPLYGESLIFIFTQDEQLKVYFLKQDQSLNEHVPPGCEKNHCPLDDFAKHVETMPKDVNKACQVTIKEA